MSVSESRCGDWETADGETMRTSDVETMLGDSRSAIRSMVLPLLVSYLVVQVNLFTDTAWCSGLGTDASSAMSAISPMYWIVMSIGTGLGVGASAAISRHLGREDKDRADSLTTQTILLSVIVGLAVTPVGCLLAGPAAEWMGAGELTDLTDAYIMPLMATSVFLVLNGSVAGILRSEGAARRSMVVLLLSAAANMALDPLMIYGLGMGLAGAGWATAVATMASTATGLWWYARGSMYLRPRMRGARVRPSEMCEVLYVGAPKAAEGILISLMSMIQRVFVIACGGPMGAALYSMSWRFVSISEVIPQAVGAALIPVCSSALGQGDLRKAERGYRYALAITMVPLIAIGIFLFVFADYCVIPFTYTGSMAEYRDEFAHVVRIYAMFIPFIGLIDIGSSVLQSLRMAQVSMLSSFARNVIIVVLLFFSYTVSMDAIYWSIFVAEVIGGLMMAGLAYRGIVRERDRQINP